MTHCRERYEAERRGEVRYEPGHPCAHGHWAERYVNGNKCVECVSQMKKRYYAENRTDILQIRKKHYVEHTDEIIDRVMAYQHANPEKVAIWKQRSVNKQRE